MKEYSTLGCSCVLTPLNLSSIISIIDLRKKTEKCGSEFEMLYRSDLLSVPKSLAFISSLMWIL